MSKLPYSATMSLDGFIAGVDGDMSWLTEHLVTAKPAVDGVPLFRQAGGTNVALEPIEPQRTRPTSLWFRVRRIESEVARPTFRS
jgi:hypothetical protein